MTSNTIILVGIALCVCSPLNGSHAATLPVASSVANKLLFGIASNHEICPLKNVIVESRYVKSCDEAKLPTGHLNLTVEDPERFLCLGVYDRISTLCYLDSIRTTGKSVIPQNSTEFDNRVAELPPTDKDSYDFCTHPKNLHPPRYEKTKMYVDELNKAMAKPGLCVKMCIYDDGSFNRLCSVIAAIEDISFHVVHSMDKSSTQVTEDTATKDKTIKNIVKTEGTVEEAVPDKLEKAADIAKHKVAPVSESRTDKEEADKNKKQSESPNRLQPQLQHSEPAPEITNPAAIPPPTAPKQGLQNEKKTKIAESETVAKPPQLGANVGSDAKVHVPLPMPKSPSSVADNPPMSGEDGYLREMENTGQTLDDPTNGEISEHTQDREEQDVDVETSEIDPPPIPPNEQIDEKLPELSEKREFVPHMPSIRNDDDSHFFGYFTVIGVICIAGYIGYYNKQKILAMVLEGRRSRGGRGRRRPSTANYRKLDCTLEEAVTSQCNSNVTHVIY